MAATVPTRALSMNLTKGELKAGNNLAMTASAPPRNLTKGELKAGAVAGPRATAPADVGNLTKGELKGRVETAADHHPPLSRESHEGRIERQTASKFAS